MNTLSTSKQKLSLAFKIIKDTVQGFVDDNVMRLSASLDLRLVLSGYIIDQLDQSEERLQ